MNSCWIYEPVFCHRRNSGTGIIKQSWVIFGRPKITQGKRMKKGVKLRGTSLKSSMGQMFDELVNGASTRREIQRNYRLSARPKGNVLYAVCHWLAEDHPAGWHLAERHLFWVTFGVTQDDIHPLSVSYIMNRTIPIIHTRTSSYSKLAYRSIKNS